MKLLTNEKNPEAVKILLAGEFSEKEIEILITTDYHDVPYPKRIPQLALDSGIHLFSSNAASKYLFPPSNNEAEINYYLDYEANVIQPLIFTFNGKMDSKLHSDLENILNKLNKTLTGQEYLVLNSISVADISIWTTLYPLAMDSKYSEKYFSSRVSLKNWFEKILKLPKVVNVLKKYSLSNSMSSLTNACSAHWFPNTSVSKINAEFDKLNVQDIDDEADHQKNYEPKVTEEEIERATESWINKSKRKQPKPVVNPVLPVPGEKNILITSALPYVNNVPHLGNIIGCVLSGDVFARFCRLRNYNTLYICGTDEYGTATETKALEEGLTPKEICNKYFQIHDSIYKWFNIKFDKFGRTTTPDQTEICQDIFLKVLKNGYILSDSVEQLLCEKCDRYLADRFVEGTCPKCAYDDARGDQCDRCGHLINATELIKPRCKICQETPVLRYSDQFFLDLPKIEPELRKSIEKSYDSWSHNAREITKAWLNDGLKPRCITRDLKWGIPVPVEGYENKVFYVWFDAPIGYISITKQYTQDWKKWWIPDKNVKVSLCQFIGKDNVPFHSVMFPSSLLGSGENFVLVDNIFATEYLNYEDGKFSKSRGVGVFGSDAKDTDIPADIWRFYLLYVRPETQDSSFSWNDLAMKNNSELLNILGNFINRALTFAEKNYKSEVPLMNLTKEDYELLAMVNRELKCYISALEKGKLREGIRRILSIARLGNQLMQMSQPWVLYKGTPEEQIRAKTVIGLSINLSCLLSILISPYMPETSEIIQKQLNAKPTVNIIEDEFYCILEAGHKIGKPFPLFNKIEMNRVEELKSKFAGQQTSKISDKKEATSSNNVDVNAYDNVASLEAAVAAQGDRVRQMKAMGKERSEWQPEVTILLDLKKKLETAKSNLQNCAAHHVNNAVNENTSELEKAIEQQGNVVRKLKESGVDRSTWQPELNKLLELKKQLALLKGDSLPAVKNGTDKKDRKK